jgi:hypothetical protein
MFLFTPKSALDLSIVIDSSSIPSMLMQSILYGFISPPPPVIDALAKIFYIIPFRLDFSYLPAKRVDCTSVPCRNNMGYTASAMALCIKFIVLSPCPVSRIVC